MSRLVEDDHLLDDMARTLTVIRLWAMEVAEQHDGMDTAVIERLHGAGLRALVYTVNDPAEVQRLCALGIDGIITDAVDRFSPAIAGP